MPSRLSQLRAIIGSLFQHRPQPSQPSQPVLWTFLTSSLLFNNIASAEIWNFNARLTHTAYDAKGNVSSTSTEDISGTRSETQYVFETLPPYSNSRRRTVCAWDGATLRWYDLIPDMPVGSDSLAPINISTSFNGHVESSFVPRSARRTVQVLAMSLVSEETFKTFTQDRTNNIRLGVNLHVPEMFSNISYIGTPFKGLNADIICNAPSWVWNVNGAEKEAVQLPEAYKNGYTNWTFHLSRRDQRAGFFTSSRYNKYIYQLDLDKRIGSSLTSLIGTVQCDITYTPATGETPSWFPALPFTVHPTNALTEVLDHRPALQLEQLKSVLGMRSVARRLVSSSWELADPDSEVNKTVEITTTRFEPKLTRRQRWLLRAFFALAILFPTVLGIRAMKSRISSLQQPPTSANKPKGTT